MTWGKTPQMLAAAAHSGDLVGVSTRSAALGDALTAALAGVLAQALATGALLTMLSDALAPEVCENGGRATGLLPVLGFTVACVLRQLVWRVSFQVG
jgi:hypothetical protein